MTESSISSFAQWANNVEAQDTALLFKIKWGQGIKTDKEALIALNILLKDQNFVNQLSIKGLSNIRKIADAIEKKHERIGGIFRDTLPLASPMHTHAEKVRSKVRIAQLRIYDQCNSLRNDPLSISDTSCKLRDVLPKLQEEEQKSLLEDLVTSKKIVPIIDEYVRNTPKANEFVEIGVFLFQHGLLENALIASKRTDLPQHLEGPLKVALESIKNIKPQNSLNEEEEAKIICQKINQKKLFPKLLTEIMLQESSISLSTRASIVLPVNSNNRVEVYRCLREFEEISTPEKFSAYIANKPYTLKFILSLPKDNSFRLRTASCMQEYLQTLDETERSRRPYLAKFVHACV